MKRPSLALPALAALAAALLVLAWLLWPSAPKTVAPAAPSPPPTSVSAPTKSPLERSGAPRRGVLSETSAAPTLAADLNSPATDIAADLRLLDSLLENFRTNFPRDGNPVGTNAEITAALAGANPLHLVVLPPDHPAINAQGELCDRWGTPFFFHQLSGTQMEIRSAGPDRRLHTADDTVLTP